MLIGHLALAVAALFTGAAFYVNFAEQPARLQLDDRALLAEWKPAYKRGFAMQASLAMLGCLLGAIAWWQTGIAAFLAGALCILAPWPWTLLVIRPINHTLMATDMAKSGPETRALIVKWNRLHAMRTLLGAAAVLCFLFALSGV
jgi:Anthrone oxygenase